MTLTEGKMFGVLVVDTSEGLGFLAAYSGLLEGRNDWPYFVPPVYDAQQPDGYFKTREREISLTTHLSPLTSHHSPLTSKKMSQELQVWLFHQYQLLNARGEKRDLVEIWQDYHCSARIRHRFPLPPGGTGDCCAPKLLQYAYSQQLKPVCMAEFWWGASPKSEIRHHGEFYPACRGKCKPVLTWMLQGLDVDPDPETTEGSHQAPETVWEDEAMAVLNKPAGMLSVPGKIGRYSVVTWAEERWSEAMIAHRLDMWTSGIILVAKTKEAYLSLQDPRQMVDYERGKRAITEYRLLHHTQDGKSLLALWPHTGRTHQLRMHCAHQDGLGCPILGDELYGRKADRLYLQAQAISFVHPTRGKRLHFELPYPFGQIIPFQYQY